MKGFTILEVMLSIAIVAILSGLSLPVFRTMLTKNDLDVATVTIAQTLRRAQTLSQAVDGDISWGVKAQSGSITLFKGTSFATRDTNFDETFGLATTIGVSGIAEYIFSRLTGLPQPTGTITLTTESDSRTVTLNEKGIVSY